MNSVWRTSTIGDLFDIGAGKSVTPTARNGSPKKPFLRTSNVFWGRIDVSDVDSMYFSDDELAAKSLQDGDLLVCEGGDIGRAAIWNGQLSGCSFQNHLHRLRARSANVVPNFYMYYLQAGFTQLGIYEGAGNKTTIPNLSRSRLSALTVPIPDRDEQLRISLLLGRAQRAIEIEEKLIATARELKDTAMQTVFLRGVRGEDLKDSPIGRIPKSWNVKPLSSVVTLQRGQDLPRSRFKGGTVPVVGATKVIGYHDAANVAGPGVTVVRSGSSAGKAFYIESDFWAHNVLLYVKDFHGNDPRFVYYKLSFENLGQFRGGVAVPSLNRNSFSAELVAMPDLAEQVEISAVLACIDRKVDLHSRRRDVFRDLFDALLHELMTGQIRVNDLDIDVSEVAA